MKRVAIVLMVMAVMALNKGFAQDSEVIVSNVYALHDTEENPLSPEAVISVWHIGFKINNPALAQKVFFELGSTAQSSDVRLVEATVTGSEGNFILTYDEKAFEIIGGEAHIDIKLSDEVEMNFVFATVYVQDTAGKNTEKLSINVKE